MADQPKVGQMSLREGRAFRNGEQVMGMVSLEVNVDLEVVSNRVVGQRGMTHKPIGYNVTGTMTEYKVTPWLRKAVEEYIETGKFPEINIQASQTDPNSDFVENHGEERVMIIGFQPTGEIPILTLDSEGETVQDEIDFVASEIRPEK